MHLHISVEFPLQYTEKILCKINTKNLLGHFVKVGRTVCHQLLFSTRNGLSVSFLEVSFLSIVFRPSAAKPGRPCGIMCVSSLCRTPRGEVSPWGCEPGGSAQSRGGQPRGVSWWGSCTTTMMMRTWLHEAIPTLSRLALKHKSRSLTWTLQWNDEYSCLHRDFTSLKRTCLMSSKATFPAYLWFVFQVTLLHHCIRPVSD